MLPSKAIISHTTYSIKPDKPYFQYLLNRPDFSNCSNGVCIMLFTLNFIIVFCYKTASDKIPHFCILSVWLMEWIQLTVELAN